MKLYQVLEHVYRRPNGMVRTGFTNKADAEREFRNAKKANQGERFKISLYQVTCPDRMTAQDWAAFLSDDWPDMQYELLDQAFGELAAVA